MFQRHESFPEAGREATWIAFAVAAAVGAVIAYAALELDVSDLVRYLALAVTVIVVTAVALPLIDRSRRRERIIEAERHEGVETGVPAH
jgi:hypothetical protein